MAQSGTRAAADRVVFEHLVSTHLVGRPAVDLLRTSSALCS